MDTIATTNKLGKNVKIKYPDHTLVSGCTIGDNVTIWAFTNLYGCTIGDNVIIASFVEICAGAKIGNNCKIERGVEMGAGAIIEDEVFLGPRVMIANTRYPRATNDGELRSVGEWKCETVVVKRGASVGVGAILCPGITVGEGALVGAGSVVTKDVPPYTIVAGNPARVLRKIT